VLPSLIPASKLGNVIELFVLGVGTRVEINLVVPVEHEGPKFKKTNLMDAIISKNNGYTVVSTTDPKSSFFHR